MLYARDSQKGRLVGMNSKKLDGEKKSSYLRELQSLVWALKDVRKRVMGCRIILHTDSNSVYQRVMGTPRDKLTEDVRAARLVGWIWNNFPPLHQLKVCFILGELNNAANLLSRWYEGKRSTVEVLDVRPSYVELCKMHRDGHWGVSKMQ